MRLEFDIHPSVVFKLGAELVTDAVQALVELIKNGYDADATRVRVTVDTAATGAEGGGWKGEIKVIDNGFGMTRENFQQGWLIVSNSPKAAMKAAGGTTEWESRVPLGDKGLGRLGAQRLGDLLIAETFAAERLIRSSESRAHPVPGYQITIDWRDFGKVNRLSKVPIKEMSLPPRRPGTTLIIRNLRDMAEWEGDAANRLADELSKLISPVQPPKNFSLGVSVNDDLVELAALEETLRETSHARWQVLYREPSADEETGLHHEEDSSDLGLESRHLEIHGAIKLAFVRPSQKASLAAFDELVAADGGRAFFRFLEKQRNFGGSGISRGSSEFVEVDIRLCLADLDATNMDGRQPVPTGSFSGSIDVFSLDPISTASQTVFSKSQDYRAHMRRLSGVRIYRDGFGVRAEADWLGLGRKFASGSSYYNLRPANTVGFVDISAKSNQALVETTDREGFVRNAAYLTFLWLWEHAITRINAAQEVLGRGYTEFLKAHQRQTAGVSETSTPRNLSEVIATTLVDESRMAARDIESIRSTAAQELSGQELKRVNLALDQLASLVDRISITGGRARILEQQVADLDSQARDMAEMAGLGLAAEALAHEITNVASRLYQASQEMRKRLRARVSPDPATAAFVEEVHASIRGLRKQLSHLDPMLRYARDQRSKIGMNRLLTEVADYHRDRVAADLQIRALGGEHWEIYASRGRLMQVLDNLILNSEYWLRDAKSKGTLSIGEIVIEANEPVLRFSDSGPGIDPSVENTLFDPFISRKAQGVGRGLGLFVVRELLEREGCTIELLDDVNVHGRRYAFAIDLAAVTL